MGREIKRVQLDFSWPLNKTWGGYLNPFYHQCIQCPACVGNGSSPQAKHLGDQWYGNALFKPEDRGSRPWTPDDEPIRKWAGRQCERVPEFYGQGEVAIFREAVRVCNIWNGMWMHHLNDLDVAALLAAGRLMDFTHNPRTDEQHEIVRLKIEAGGNSWLPESNGYVPTPAEVNAWSLVGMGHDSINCWTVVKAECLRLGYPRTRATTVAYDERITRFYRWLGTKAATKQVLKQYLSSMIASGLANQTIKLHHQTLRQWFNWLVEEHQLKENPVGKIRLDVPESRRRGFTNEEVEKLLLCANGEWKAMILVGYETGLRLGDIATLQWPSVDLAERVISVMPSKTKRFAKKVSIPMTEQLAEQMKTIQPNMDHVQYVFPHASVHYRTDGSKSLSAQFHSLAKRAGVSNGGYHGLRYSFVSRLVDSGANHLVIISMTGHSISEVGRYAHPSNDAKRDALTMLNR